MPASDQPNQAAIGLVNANGVLTITGDLFCNPGVATSLADETSATTTVTSPSSGHVRWVTVITPTTAIVSSDNTVGGAIRNLNA